MKDVADNQVEVGDIIVYGTLLGRSASLQFGLVTKVYTVEDTVYDSVLGTDGFYKHTRRKIDAPRVNVRGAKNNWNRGYQLLNNGTLQFSNRMLKVSRDMVPSEVLELFDGFSAGGSK
jgi:hypothetical protein